MRNRDRSLFIAGLALWWPMLRGNYFVTFFSPAAAPHIVDAVYVMIALAGLALFAWPRTETWLTRTERGEAAGIALTILTTSTSILMLAIGVLGSTGQGALLPLVMVAGVLAACSFAALAVGWGIASFERLRTPAARTLALDTALAFFLNFALTALTRVASLEWQFAALCPLASAALLALLARRDAPAHQMERANVASKDGAAARPALPQTVHGLGTCVLLAAFVLAASSLVGCFTSPTGVFGDDAPDREMASLVISTLFVVAVLAVGTRRFGMYLLWGATLLVLMFGALLALLFEGPAGIVGANLVLMGRRITWVLLFLYLADEALPSRGAANAMRLFALLYVVLQAAIRLVLRGTRALVATTGASDPLVLAIAMLLMLALVLIVMAAGGISVARYATELAGLAQAQRAVTAQPASDDAEPPASSAPSPSSLRRAACEAIATECGLTGRETEILEMLSMGNSVERIAELGSISPNTVRTHTKHIYMKIDCHSKQDVINLVERRMGTLTPSMGS